MAYQPKSYRKFVATAATAAMVASAVAPVAASTTTEFSDVPASYKDAVDYLVSTGATQGVGGGKFGTDSPIKRGDAAAMVAAIKGYDLDSYADAGFSDVPTRLKGAVNALKAEGIINGKTETSFDPDGVMKRSEMAKVIALAFDLEAGDTVAPFSDVSATFADFINALYANDVTQGVGGGKYGSDQQIKRGDFAKFVFKAAGEVTPATPEVVGVSAIDARTIQVDFNKVVGSTSAKTLANYSINGKGLDHADFTGASIALSADSKSAIITLDLSDKLLNGTAYAVKVADVADENGTEVADYSQTLLFNDVATPEIVTVSGTAKTTTNTIKVKFNEPVAGTGVYKIDGVGVAVSSGQGTDELVLSTGALEAGETYTLFVANETDISSAANNLASSEYSFTVTVDDVAPVATAAAVSDKTIEVTFNEEVKASTVTTSNLRIKDANGFIFAQLNAPTTTDNKTFTLTLASNPFLGDATSKDFKVEIANVEDVAGNKITSVVKDVTVTKDTTAPYYVSTTDVTTSGFNIQFSENVTKNGSPSITIVSSKGVEVAGVVGTTTSKKLAVTATLTEGETYTYTLVKDAVQDSAWTANKSAVVTGSFTVEGSSDSSRPSVVTASPNAPKVSATNNDHLVVTFSEAVKGGAVAGSATDVYNYKLDGTALPTGTVITLDSTMKVATIKLPAGTFSASGTKQLTVSNVQDASGNAMNTTTHAVTVVDTKAPVLTSAKVTSYASSFVVDLQFNEDLTGTVTSAISNIDRNIKLMNGSVEVTGFTATLENDADGNPRIVRLTKAASLDATKAVTVETKAATNLADNVVLDAASRTDSLGVTGKNPLLAGLTVTAVDGVAPSAPSVTQVGGDVITANGIALDGGFTANQGVTSVKVKYADASD